VTRILLSIAAAVVLSVSTIAASASASVIDQLGGLVAPSQSASSEKEKNQSDDMKHPARIKQDAARDKAIKDKIAGKAKGKVHEVAKGQFVELEREGTDKIFVVIAEFANARHIQFPNPTDPCTVPAGFSCFNADGSAATYVGPLHNSIPEPDRAVDNSTLWQDDYNKAHYENMYFDRMAEYYERQSSGRYSVEGAVTEWVRVPFNEARYGRDFCGGIVCNNTWQLVRHSVNIWVADQIAAGRFANVAAATEYLKTFDQWDRYDFDSDGNFNERDGYIDHFQIVHAGGDQAAGDPHQGSDAIWSHRWFVNFGAQGAAGPSVDGVPNLFGGYEIGGAIPASSQIGGAPITFPTNPTGIWVGDYTIQPENGGLGVFAHEYGHDLGLPDLYDTSGNTGGAENSTGFWTLMSSGANIGNGGPDGIGDQPTNMGAWEKLMLGWLNYEVATPGKNSEHKLTPGGTNTKQAQAVIAILDPALNPNTLTLGTPPEGTKAFWSNMGDGIDTNMTRDVTIPAGTSTLSFKAWYEIETCWDYAYLRASTNGGTTWTNVATSLSDAGNENGQNFGNGITGISGSAKHCDESSGNPAWVTGTANLSAFAGQTVKLQFRYWTDPFVQARGFEVDDVRLNGTLIGGAESTTEGWTFTGFKTTTGNEISFHEHYYIAEYRNYGFGDESLRTAYNFGFLTTTPDRVEFQPYQDGLLITYWDTGESDNSVGDHPGSGLILPVDAHPTLDHWSNGELMRGRIQTADSTFGLERTDAFTLHLNNVPTTIASKPAAPIFDDRKDYWFASDGHTAASHGRHQVGWMSVRVPKTGTIIEVKNSSAQGFFMNVAVSIAK
jgi:immune inhibitor A